MTTQSPDQSNSQSPAPSKEMEDFIQSLAARTLREMMAEAIPVGVLVKAFHSLAAELGKEREAEAPKPSAFQSWDSVRERYYAEKDGEEYQTAVYIERLKAEIDEKGERIDTLKRELAEAELCTEAVEVVLKEKDAQLLALSASYQRQKDALGWLEGWFYANIDGGGKHGCPWCYMAKEDKPWIEAPHTPDCVIGKALAETPDVSLLERYQYLATVAKEVIEADDAAIAEIEAMGVEPETRLTSKLKYALNALLSTLQPDHQK